MDESSANYLNSFPWEVTIVVAVLSSFVLTAINYLFFKGKAKGWWNKLIMVIVITIAALTKMSLTNLKGVEGIQAFVFNFLSIFSIAVIYYETVGKKVIEQKLIPWILQKIGIDPKSIYVSVNKDGDGL